MRSIEPLHPQLYPSTCFQTCVIKPQEHNHDLLPRKLTPMTSSGGDEYRQSQKGCRYAQSCWQELSTVSESEGGWDVWWPWQHSFERDGCWGLWCVMSRVQLHGLGSLSCSLVPEMTSFCLFSSPTTWGGSELCLLHLVVASPFMQEKAQLHSVDVLLYFFFF